MPGPFGSKPFLPWFFSSHSTPTGYPLYLRYTEAGPTGSASVEPAITAYAPGVFLSDGSDATYYSAGIGASLPAAMVSGIIDFGTRVRITGLAAKYQASLLAGGGTSTYNYDTGVDDGAGGIIWTERSAGTNDIQPDVVPTLVSTRSITAGSIDARYIRFTLFTSGGNGQIRLVELGPVYTTICDPPLQVTGLSWSGTCEGAFATIKFLPAVGATGYKVRLDGATVRDIGARTAGVDGYISYIWAPLTVGTSYSFEVLAYNACGDGPYSAVISVLPCIDPPPPCPTPLKVTGLSTVAICEGAQITLTWNAAADTLFYNVRSGTSIIASATSPSYILTPATIGQAYSLSVRAVNACGPGEWSDTLAVTPCSITPDPPGIPTGLAGTGVCEGAQITLTWNAVPGAELYKLRVNGTTIIEVGNVTTYVLSPVVIGVPYTFEVASGNANGQSGWSAAISITPCSNPPESISLYSLGTCEGSRVTLWVSIVPGTVTNEVQRADYGFPNGRTIYDGDPISEELPFVDTTAEIGVTYRYRARACNDSGCSAWTAWKSITPCRKNAHSECRPCRCTGCHPCGCSSANECGMRTGDSYLGVVVDIPTKTGSGAEDDQEGTAGEGSGDGGHQM